MESRRVWAALAICASLTLLGIWLAYRTTEPAAEQPEPAERQIAFNGTLTGTSQEPARWSTNLTLEPGVHEILASASWHRTGPAIHMSLVFPNGTVVHGLVPGNYQFTQARAHAGAQTQVMVVLTSEVRESFELDVTFYSERQSHATEA